MFPTSFCSLLFRYPAHAIAFDLEYGWLLLSEPFSLNLSPNLTTEKQKFEPKLLDGFLILTRHGDKLIPHDHSTDNCHTTKKISFIVSFFPNNIDTWISDTASGIPRKHQQVSNKSIAVVT